MRVKTIQTSFLSGVLDSRAVGRADTESYQDGLLVGTNVVVNHLGGVRRRDGLKFHLELPGQLTYLTPSSATVPEGGTAASGYDDDDTTLVVTTGEVGTTDPYIVIRYDLGEEKRVIHADVRRISATGGESDEFRIQYSTDDASWTDFGDALPKIDNTERTYRRTALSSGKFSSQQAQYWRVVKIGGTDMTTAKITISAFDLWLDSAAVSNVRLFSYELTTDNRYLIAVTDRSATFFKDDAIPTNGTIPMPYESSEIPDIDYVVGEDLMYLVHEDHPVRFILNEFDDEDFQTGDYQFNSVAQHDYNDDDSSTPTSEIQAAVFDSNWKQGDTFQLELDGARTALISYAGDSGATDQLTTATNIAREVQKLYSVPGHTGVTCSRSGVLTYTVTFANASAKAYDGLMTATIGTVVSSSAVSPVITRSQAGVSRGEDVWSATRGYPRTVAFFGGRLWFGGTRSKLQSLFGSAVGDATSFELLEQLDADPIFITLNSQQLNAITALHSGRNLEIFTSAGELRYVKGQGDPITPADAPALQTQHGTKKLRPVNMDDTTIFLQRLGKSVRDFQYDFERDAYTSLGLTSLAPSMVNTAVDLSAWKGTSTDEINLLFVVNGDGTVGVLNLRREANVRAWTHWETDGLFKAVVSTVEEVYFAVQRTVGGVDKLFLEETDPDMYVDAGVNVTGGVTDNVIHLDGETCRVRAQTPHFVLADQTGGTVTPTEEDYADGEIQVGLEFNPIVTPMPFQTSTGVGASNFMDKRRIKKIRVKLNSTLGLLINGRVLPDRYYDVDDFDASPVPLTGNVSLPDTSNWDEAEDKTVPFTQVDPLPMEILSISVDMESA